MVTVGYGDLVGHRTTELLFAMLVEVYIYTEYFLLKIPLIVPRCFRFRLSYG